MGKFNKNLAHDRAEASDDEVNWEQVFGSDHSSKSVEEKTQDLMRKFVTRQDVEFDQVCLLLKHLLTQNRPMNDNSTQTFVDYFLSYDNQTYVNLLVEKFDASPDLPNVQWMISEIFKLLSSISNEQQASLMVCSAEFSRLLLTSVFDPSILDSIKSHAAMTLTQATTLMNLFETISNLCEIKPEIVEFVTHTHIEWLAHALVAVNPSYTDLAISIARLMGVICEQASSRSKTELVTQLLVVFEKEEFFKKVLEHFSDISPSSAHLNPKLHVIAAYVNLIVSESKKSSGRDQSDQSKASKILLDILKRFGELIHHALKVDLKNESTVSNEAEHDIQPDESDPSPTLVPHQDDCKLALNSFDRAIEAKLISIDLINSIAGFFIQDDNENDDESCESLDEDEETAGASESNEMDVDNQGNNKGITTTTGAASNPEMVVDLVASLNNFQILSLLVKTIHNDDENSYQEANRIEHVYNSIKLIRNESLRVYLQLVENFYVKNTTTTTSDITVDNQLMDHLRVFMNLIAHKSVEDLELFEAANESGGGGGKNETVIKLAELVYDLYVYFDSSKSFSLSIDQASSLVSLIKTILFKFRTSIAELCVRMARILGLVGIRLRNHNLDESGKIVIKECGLILLELTSASFDLSGEQNSSSVESLRMNAELLDVIIDLFGEDNTADVEASLNFIDRVRALSDKFYSKYKIVVTKKNRKINKGHSAIIKTVKDNFKQFVDYKIKNSK